MKYIADILKQFSKEQKILVLFILLFFISGTYIFTTYLSSPQNNCHEVIELNKKYVSDFVKISDMIRKERMKDVGLDSMMMVVNQTEGASAERGSQKVIVDPPQENLLDSILKITEKVD